jgi:hypothetical protein
MFTQIRNQQKKKCIPSIRARCLEIHPPIALSNPSGIVYQNLLQLRAMYLSNIYQVKAIQK